MKTLALIALLCGLVLLVANCRTDPYDLVITGGRVMDPDSGLDAVRNIGIRDGQIAEVTADPLAGRQEIDASGLIVAPGFIDLHAHGQNQQSYRLMVQDGVTSGFELEVGTDNVDQWYQERDGGQPINYGVSIGHIPVRMAVMDDPGDFLPTGAAISQVATPRQIEEIALRIEEGLKEGALAVGFGWAYTPAASDDEIETIFRLADQYDAPAHMHVRSGLEGVSEAIEAARKTGASLHVVHANSSGGPDTVEFLRRIDQARQEGLDVTTEAYPYSAGMTSIQSALFDDWESWDEDRFAIHQWVATGERLDRESFARYRQQGGMVIIHERTEEMTRDAIGHPLTMIASDGLMESGKGHPRTAGTYSRVLGKYVREEGLLTLMEALAKMTIMPARRLQERTPAMAKKGRLQTGADADITIFDPEVIIDQATYTDPTRPSKGIEFVLVGGQRIIDAGELILDLQPGRPVRGATKTYE